MRLRQGYGKSKKIDFAQQSRGLNRMKKIWMFVTLLLSLATICYAADIKVEAPADCEKCGMNRTKFAQSRMIVTYADGSSTGTCSINCAIVDQKKSKKEVKSFQVGDYNSKKLIDAKNAAWVIGGTKKGVMTPVAKWAFVEKKDADAFIKANAGSAASFDDVVKATEKELADRDQKKKSHDNKGHGDHKM
jgi:nitrous oxide reductase accessory protein NosL